MEVAGNFRDSLLLNPFPYKEISGNLKYNTAILDQIQNPPSLAFFFQQWPSKGFQGYPQGSVIMSGLQLNTAFFFYSLVATVYYTVGI